MPTLAQTASDMIDAEMPICECEREIRKALIVEALTRTCGYQCRAAKLLGWHRNTLHTAIKELKISVRPFRLLPKRAVKFVPHQEMRA